MNKRRLAVFTTAVLLVGISILGLMVVRMGTARSIEPHPANKGKASVSAQTTSPKTEIQSSDSKTADEKPNLTVIKPKSIKMGQGATAEVEIDHGLQAVDFMKGERHSAAVTHARDKGALGAVTFSVIDDRGQPVSGATVKAAFWNHGKEGHEFEETTDENGLVALQDTCVGDLVFSITKDDHYDTRLRYWFFKAHFDCAKNGRWIPWNPTIEVVLKRKVNPVAMYVTRQESGYHLLNEVEKPLGFDLVANDWLPPFGKGTTADMFITFFWDGSKFSQYTGSDLELSFTNQYAGIYRAVSDMSSAFRSPYHADTNAVYAKSIRFSYKCNPKGGIVDGQLREGECLILRVRPRLDRDGNLIGALYAKIYGPFIFGFGDKTPGSMSMHYYLNPTENDTNLEADTSRNLLNPRDLGFAP